MKNKKAWLRIVEAVIAVLLVASILILMITKAPRQDTGENMHGIQRFILEQISANETLRAEILQNQNSEVNKSIGRLISPNWNFTTRICGVNEICGMPFYVEGNIYADEILIASNLTQYSPKKLKLFVWVG